MVFRQTVRQNVTFSSAGDNVIYSAKCRFQRNIHAGWNVLLSRGQHIMYSVRFRETVTPKVMSSSVGNNAILSATCKVSEKQSRRLECHHLSGTTH